MAAVTPPPAPAPSPAPPPGAEAAGQATEFFENQAKVFGNSPRDA